MVKPNVKMDEGLDFGESGDWHRVVDTLKEPLAAQFEAALRVWVEQMFDESRLVIRKAPGVRSPWIVEFVGWNQCDAQATAQWPLDYLLSNLWLSDGDAKDAANLAAMLRAAADRIDKKIQSDKRDG